MAPSCWTDRHWFAPGLRTEDARCVPGRRNPASAGGRYVECAHAGDWTGTTVPMSTARSQWRGPG